MWGGDVSLGSVSCWCKETCRSRLPPVTKFLMVDSFYFPGAPNFMYILPPAWICVLVALCLEETYSCALLGVLAHDTTFSVSRSEQHRRIIPSSLPYPFCPQGLLCGDVMSLAPFIPLFLWSEDLSKMEQDELIIFILKYRTNFWKK